MVAVFSDAMALLLLKVQREARCNPGEAVERRLKIEMADAVGECVDFVCRKHACEARYYSQQLDHPIEQHR